MQRVRLILLILCLIIFPACASAPAIDPFPTLIRANCPWYKWSPCPPARSWEEDLSEKWNRSYDKIADSVKNYEAATTNDDRVRHRNDYTERMFSMIDEEQLHYQSSIRQTKAFSDLFMDVGVLGLTASATVVGGEATKAVLSAAATALGATKIAVNKAFFEEAAMSSILNQIDAARSIKKLAIRGLRDKSDFDYPLVRAQGDMLLYLFSGSVISAIKTLAEDSAEKKRKASEALEKQAKDPSETIP
jgi:hypothetical protein